MYTTMGEVLGYDWNNFLADLGGSLGFLLGLSVVGVYSWGEEFVSLVVAKKNRRVDNKVENSTETEKDILEGKSIPQNDNFK